MRWMCIAVLAVLLVDARIRLTLVEQSIGRQEKQIKQLSEHAVAQATYDERVLKLMESQQKVNVDVDKKMRYLAAPMPWLSAKARKRHELAAGGPR